MADLAAVMTDAWAGSPACQTAPAHGNDASGDESSAAGIHESESGLQLPPHDQAPLLKVDVLKLHPTQLAVGSQQVAAKAAKMEGKGFLEKPKKKDKWLAKRPIPVVLGPPPASMAGAGPVMYLVDHHHLARALLSLGLKECYCQVVEDVSSLGLDQFWEHMRARGYVWPYDASGHLMDLRTFAAALPTTVESLSDDPFRSLAALVRNAGGYEKVWVPFSEFRWANWLRAAVPAAAKLGPDHPSVMQTALAAVRLPEASQLPGFLGEQGAGGAAVQAGSDS